MNAAKKYLLFFISGFLFISLTSASTYPAMMDKVIVVVNDEVVTQREFDRMFLPIKESYEANFKGEELNARLEAARKGLLEQLINSKLVTSLAKKEKMIVDKNELKDRMDKIRSYYPSETAFLQDLDAKGTSLSEFEREISDQMLAQKLVEKEIASKIGVTPSEVKTLYEKNKDKLISPKRLKVRTIMVRKAEGEAQGLDKEKAERILGELKQGKDFAALAVDESEGPYAKEGGDMGFVTKGKMLKEIDDVIFSLKEREASNIIESHIGFHIFKVEKIEEERRLELSEVNEFLREQLYMRKFETELLKWLEEKRKNAYISYK